MEGTPAGELELRKYGGLEYGGLFVYLYSTRRRGSRRRFECGAEQVSGGWLGGGRHVVLFESVRQVLFDGDGDCEE